MNKRSDSWQLQEFLQQDIDLMVKQSEEEIGDINFECPWCHGRQYLRGDKPIAGANWYYCSNCEVKFVDPLQFSRTSRGELGEAENGCFLCGCNKHEYLYALPEELNAPMRRIGKYCIHCSSVICWY